MKKFDKMDGDSNEGTITVSLVKRKQGGVGFLARNASPYLAVSHVVKGSMAHETGFIEEGDVILEVNGKSLEKVPYVKALEILDKVPAGETVALKIRAQDGFQAYLETAFDKEGVVKTVRSTKPKIRVDGTTGMDEKMNGEKQEPKKSEKENLAAKERELVEAVPSTKSETPADGSSSVGEKVNGEKQVTKKSEKEKPALNGSAEKERQVDHSDNKNEVRSETTGVHKCPVTNATSNYQQPKFIKLQHVMDQTFTTDTLHQKAIEVS